MIEDDATVDALRATRGSRKFPARSFMAASELVLLRTTVIKTTQKKLGEQLIKPDDGLPTHKSTVANWEQGIRAVPLWVARRVRELAECAKRYDARREG